MRLTASLLAAASLSTSVTAFYPYQLNTEISIGNSLLSNLRRRFMPWKLQQDDSKGSDSQGSSNLLTLDCDVTSQTSIDAAFAKALSHFGRIDVVCNNAGVFAPHPITETSYEQWQRGWQHTIGVNLVGAANVT